MAETIERVANPPLPEPVWDRIQGHTPRLLLLDFDGTLAPFEVNRMAVRVPEASCRAIERIARSAHDRVAVVSGRPIRELQQLLGNFPGVMAGEHGWEEKSALGVVCRHTPGLRARFLLKLAEWVAVFMRCGDHLERKRASIVLHTRGVTSHREQRRLARCARVLQVLIAHERMKLDTFNGGWELRDRTRSKGTIAADLIANGPPDPLPVFLGDDTSDEDAFAVVRPIGITVRVGTDPRASAAEWALESPDAVAEFLERWAEISEEA